MGCLPTLMQHGQDKELNLRQATLEVCFKKSVLHLYDFKIQYCTPYKNKNVSVPLQTVEL